jgi:hypothetical protein
MADELVAESYEANTVEELREELRARDLPVSGHKDELVARLEENDAAQAGGSQEVAVQEGEAAPPVVVTDPYKMVYNPLELPANTAAAEAMAAVLGDAVDPSAPISDERSAQATAAIQDHVDQMADQGTPVEDPRLPDSGPIPDPSLDSIYPESSVVGPPANITLSANGANFLVTTQIGFGVFSQEEADVGMGEAGAPKWERTTFVDSSTLTTIITAGLFPGPDAIPVVVGEPDGTTSSSVNFTFTEPEAPLEEGAQ